MRWFKNVKAGDKLRPIPDWNRTERGGNQLPDPVEILRAMEATSQSGVLFTVRTKDGTERNLDAAWFIKPNVKWTAHAPHILGLRHVSRKRWHLRSLANMANVARALLSDTE